MNIEDIEIKHSHHVLLSAPAGTFEPETGKMAINGAGIETSDVDPSALPDTFAIATFSFHSTAGPRRAKAAVKVLAVDAGFEPDTYDIEAQAIKMQLT